MVVSAQYLSNTSATQNPIAPDVTNKGWLAGHLETVIALLRGLFSSIHCRHFGLKKNWQECKVFTKPTYL